MLVVVALIALIALLRTLPVVDWLDGAEAWVDEHPVAGASAYLAATIVSVVALTPGWIPMTLAGLLFGLLPGVLYALAGITVGATIALIAGRTLARRWVEHRIAGNEQLLALDDALEDQAFTIVALTRLALVIPFNMLNYAYGLTRVRTPVYAAATAAGMLPVIVMYAYFGTLARDIGAVLAGDADPGPRTWWLAGIAATAIVLVVIVVRRAVGRALEKRTGAAFEHNETDA